MNWYERFQGENSQSHAHAVVKTSNLVISRGRHAEGLKNIC